MRIRKRWPHSSPPQPHASAAPDLSFNRTSQQQREEEEQKRVVGLHPNGDLSVQEKKYPFCSSDSPYQPIQRPSVEDRPHSDLELVMIKGRNGWVCTDGDEDGKICCMLPNPPLVQVLKGGEEEDAKEKWSGAGDWKSKGNGNSLGAGIAAGFQLPSASFHQALAAERWCEGEKEFPLKKRRGGYEWGKGEETKTIINKEKMTKTKMKKTTAPTKKKGEVEEEKGDGISSGNIVKKRGTSSSAAMEGSRCSRVNGRGWRCCQQTLVGYSLCEHHLGKGRLRSMASVRISSKPKKNEANGNGLLSLSSSQHQKPLHSEAKDKEEKPILAKKRRKRIGSVKARSMSSLLGQLHQTAGTPPSPSSDHNNVSA